MKLNQTGLSFIDKVEYNKNIQKVTNNPYFQKFVSVYSNPKNLAPILTLELATIFGRSAISYKRGGWYELKERVFDEISTSLIWLFGVKVLNVLADNVALKSFKVNTKIDWKDPLKEFSFKRGESFKNRLVAAKFLKMIFSVGTSLYLVGAVIPKINQWWTRVLIANDYKDYLTEAQRKELKRFKTTPETTRIGDMLRQHYQEEKPSSKRVSFRGKNGEMDRKSFFPASSQSFKNNPILGAVETAGYLLDHNAIAQTFIIDLGLSGGRAYHARNPDEALEILYRDLVSVFFYSFCVPFLNIAFAKKFDPHALVNTRLHISAVDPVNTFLLNAVKKAEKEKGGSLHFDELAKVVLGDKDPRIQELVTNLRSRGLDKIQLNTLEKQFRNTSNLTSTTSVQDNYKLITQFVENIQMSPKVLIQELQKFGQNISTGYVEKNVRTIYNIVDDVCRRDPSYSRKLYAMDRVLDAYHTMEETSSNGKLKSLAEFVYKKLKSNMADSTVLHKDLSHYFTLDGKLITLEDRKGLLKAIDGVLKQEPVVAIKMLSDDLYTLAHQGGHVTQYHLEALDKILARFKSGKRLDEINELRSSIGNIFQLGDHQTVTLQELEKVLRQGAMGTHDFDKLVRSLHNPSPDTKTLSEPKSLETFHQNIETHVTRLLENIKRKVGNEKVSGENLLNIMNAQKNRQFLLKAGYIVSGLIISGTFLSYVIPKTQNLMTYKRTGKKGFPGVKGLIPDIDDKGKKHLRIPSSLAAHDKAHSPMFISFEKKSLQHQQ